MLLILFQESYCRFLSITVKNSCFPVKNHLGIRLLIMFCSFNFLKKMWDYRRSSFINSFAVFWVAGLVTWELNLLGFPCWQTDVFIMQAESGVFCVAYSACSLPLAVACSRDRLWLCQPSRWPAELFHSLCPEIESEDSAMAYSDVCYMTKGIYFMTDLAWKVVFFFSLDKQRNNHHKNFALNSPKLSILKLLIYKYRE